MKDLCIYWQIYNINILTMENMSGSHSENESIVEVKGCYIVEAILDKVNLILDRSL
jgi:hypothetical protein